MRPVNDEEVILDLARRTNKYGAAKKLAETIGMLPGSLRSIKSGSQSVTQKVAEALGWELRWVKREKGQVHGRSD